MQILGSGFDYCYLLAVNMRRGVLVAWRAAIWSGSSCSTRSFSVSVRLRYLPSSVKWCLTSVYGPANDDLKPAFLQELSELYPLRSGPWLLTGDFTMIYRAADKNNDRLNLRLMGRFCRFLNAASLKEFHLEGKLFTWSNERSHPTLERFDRAFVSQEWDELYSNCDLRSLASGCSDHGPLLLRTEFVLAYRRHFHFRSYWPKLHAYLEVVQRAWSCLIPDANPFRKLEWLLRNTSKAL
jgi:hypothetical protein